MELAIFTPADYRQILRSRVALPRAARRFGLTPEQVKTIQSTFPGFYAVWEMIYGDQTLMVRLNEPMSGESAGSPQVGEIGPLRDVSDWEDQVKLSVRWPGGSHLMALYPGDNVTLLTGD